jgi:5'-deoxynucleotidase YfbR-like HD superfamily hydrolase
VNDNAWIRTFTGRQFFVLEPRVEDVCIEDIAHALSMQCRFVGHVDKFYSVAEHSVRVSFNCGDQALYGLLHDASEAYIGDMSAPLKHQTEMSRFRTTERHIMTVVAEKFGLDPKEPASVKTADRRMLLTEARDLGLDVTGWYTEHQPFPETIIPWSPSRAEFEFLYRFKQLTEPYHAPQADGWVDQEADVHG